MEASPLHRYEQRRWQQEGLPGTQKITSIEDNWAVVVVGHGGRSSGSGPLLLSGVQHKGFKHGQGQ